MRLHTTGSRERFFDALRQASAQADRTGEQMALHYLRLGGTDNGSPLLVPGLGAQLQQLVRSCDTLTALAPRTYVVLQRSVGNLDGVTTFARKLLDATGDFLASRCLADATPHVGIALHRRKIPTESLLSQAEHAWQSAQTSRERGFRYDSQSSSSAHRSELLLQHSLQHALNRAEFFLEFQPQVEPVTREVLCVEALLRWQHPELGLVQPSEFIPVAERTGLISDIGTWVALEACLRCREWNQGSLPDVPVAINVSATELNDPDLPTRLRAVCREARLPHNMLELEVTERVLMPGDTGSEDVLGEILSAGIAISIDDFGTGYCSLQYLKELPAKKIKIPIEFVANVAKDSADRAIVEAAVRIAHGLEMNVVAEGVETLEQAEMLGSLDCDALQGFLFGSPARRMCA